MNSALSDHSATPATSPFSTSETIDTVAALVRTYGKLGFDLAADMPGAFAGEAERWARRILVGPTRDDHMTERSLPELRRWFETRRRAEKSYVESHLGGFRSAVSDLVRGVRGLLVEDRKTDHTIDEHLARLEEAVASGRMEAIPTLIPKAVEGIRGALAARNVSFRTQLSAMGSRIASLRDDLDTTRREAELDPLTRVFNRAVLDRVLEQSTYLAEGTSEPFMLAFVDLDRFKVINDTYGHGVGDSVLRATADTLVRSFPRKDDLVARYGGEEFCVIVRDVDSAARDRLVLRLLTQVRALSVPAGDTAVQVRCSVGTALWRSGDDARSMLARADQALYAAKHGGRDRAVHG